MPGAFLSAPGPRTDPARTGTSQGSDGCTDSDSMSVAFEKCPGLVSPYAFDPRALWRYRGCTGTSTFLRKVSLSKAGVSPLAPRLSSSAGTWSL